MPAGGFRTFVAGEVLDQDDINNFLMQGILVFAGSSARDAAVTAPVEGQFVFLTDTDTLQFYDGSAWVQYEAGYPTPTVASTTGSPANGTFTDANGITWEYYKWTGSGSITFGVAGFADCLVVGAGGGSARSSSSPIGSGSWLGGGGAGAVRYGLQYVPSSTLSVTVGSGGAGATNTGEGGAFASNGGASVLGSMTSGGGRGGAAQPGNSGGSGSAPSGGGSGHGFAGGGSANTQKGGAAGATTDTGIALNYDGTSRDYGTASTSPAANTGGGGAINAGAGAAGVVIVAVLV